MLPWRSSRLTISTRDQRGFVESWVALSSPVRRSSRLREVGGCYLRGSAVDGVEDGLSVDGMGTVGGSADDLDGSGDLIWGALEEEEELAGSEGSFVLEDAVA